MSFLESVWGFIVDVVTFLLAIPIVIVLLVIELPAALVKLYYHVFPGALRAKERREKAELLVTYEELARKREELRLTLVEQTELLEDLISRIQSVDANVFERRQKSKSAESIMQGFDSKKLFPYEKIKDTAVDYENTLFKVFTVCKKLEVYGINRGVKQLEEDEEE